MSVVPHPELIAQRYQVHDLIGAGGLAYVFRGWDNQRQRAIAIKWLKDSAADSQPNPRMAEQLWREAMALTAVQHPHIVLLLDFGVEEQGAYVITELIEGETLEVTLGRGPFSLADFVLFADQTLQGLAAAHRVNLVHRDVNPTNFILEPSHEASFSVKILDFGLAKFIHKPQPQTLDHQNTLMGSIHYVSPEQFQRQPLDARTDLYALGCISYEMLTGREAFQGASMTEIMTEHLTQWPPSIRSQRPEVSEELEAWVMKLLEKKPENRPESAEWARTELLALSEKIKETAELGARAAG